ncbi:MAG: (2Fe-2S)-binding protein [Bacteroidetes bacterium GWF2_33_16]|nr:MAG: (2Fe-2S)-binding protein [Bacteroidetes bacterium GWE2_32_14]OFY02261.1 MAG: (2Fe-2S)-binding protein [Bacteroidetes bacterium GWF2_33_16]
MITFILNNQLIQTDKPAGKSLLDFIRYKADLPGTKIGCREGDCGACTVLEGQLNGKEVIYKSIVSCLTPLGNAHGKHIVTIEGINMKHLSPIQNAMVENAATQCGFCTPGFVMSFTGLAMAKIKPDKKMTIASVSGNICRCTGYKSIEKAADNITTVYKDKNVERPVEWLVQNKFLPDYFLNIPNRLAEIKDSEKSINPATRIIGGGTDLMVQKPDEIYESELNLFFNRAELKSIKIDNNCCIIGAAATASDLMQSKILCDIIPELKDFFKLISSEPIRNMGTIAGNIMNASPIADLSIFFIALNSNIHLNDGKNKRIFPLKDFFLAYKKLNIKKGEYVESLSFPIPDRGFLFNFEKVSKRTYLDIASVNTAIYLRLSGENMIECSISAGGISPIPLFLKQTSEYLTGKQITNGAIIKANTIMQEEIAPISDIRGNAEYKRLLLRQLLFAHFIKLFPKKISLKELVS